MKIKSVSGLTMAVKSLDKTAKFYEALGFEIRKREAERMSAYSNWFWIDFVAGAKARAPKPASPAKKAAGEGIAVYLSVDDVDAFHKQLVGKGLKPKSEPKDTEWGNREFALLDPDGYRLVFFKRK
jgi:catechol 2,3-dioxygenase-like lactoylglutathione lyase family enzyme